MAWTYLRERESCRSGPRSGTKLRTLINFTFVEILNAQMDSATIADAPATAATLMSKSPYQSHDFDWRCAVRSLYDDHELAARRFAEHIQYSSMQVEVTMAKEFDAGAFNARILAKIPRSRLTRFEKASVPLEIELRSPEMKRLFAREFEGMQGNLYIMLTLARFQFPAEVVKKAAQTIRHCIDTCKDEVGQEISTAWAQLDSLGITHRLPYAAPPIEITVRARSELGLNYLRLIESIDRLLQMLETLAAEHHISGKQLGERKAYFKREVRRIAQMVRAWKVEREQIRTAKDRANWPTGLR